MYKWMLAVALALTVAVPSVAQEKEPAKEPAKEEKKEEKTEEKKDEKKTESKPDEKAEEKKDEKKDGEEGRKATVKDLANMDYQKPYRTKGNTWTHKTTGKSGDYEFVSYMKYEILEVTKEKAKYKMTMMDDKKEETYSEEYEYEFTEVEKSEEKEEEGGEPEVEMEGRVVKLKVTAGEFECFMSSYKDEEGKSESKYYSDLKTGVIVKTWSKGEDYETTMELIEFKVS